MGEIIGSSLLGDRFLLIFVLTQVVQTIPALSKLYCTWQI